MSFTDLRMPSKVFTPPRKLVRDIKRYILPNCDRRQIARVKKDKALWRKLVVLAERLEFVAKLEVVRKKIDKCTKLVPKYDRNGNLLRRDYKYRWLKEDFSGVHKDIESLEIYLLVSAVDEMAGNDKPPNQFDWLKNHPLIPTESAPRSDWGADIEQLKKKYYEEHGMAKGIERMFTDCLSKDIKDEWVDSYVALKMREKDEEWLFEENDYNNYLAKTKDEQFRLLIKALIDIRNSYTHAAFRAFECDHELYSVQYGIKDKLSLLMKSKERRNLITLLQASVMSIATKVFCGK